MRIHPNNKDELPIHAGKKLFDLLLSVKDKKVLLLLSGGSSLNLLSYVDPLVCGSGVTISVIDERVDINESNFNKLLETSFFKKSIKNGALFIDPFVTEGDTYQTVENRLNQSLLSWVNNNKEGIIIATLGMGDDGHIAGIMPFPESESTFYNLFEDTNVLMRGYDAGLKNKFPYRVTSTLSLLKLVNFAVAFISGDSKRNALSLVLQKNKPVNEIPASVLNELQSVDLYTDIRNLPVVE